MTVERVVTSGTFTLDGDSFAVDNNIWLVGDDTDVIVIDAAHDAHAIAEAVGDRHVVTIVCTHGHNDHINAAVALAERTGAPIALHPADRELWDSVHPGRAPDLEITDGTDFCAGGVRLTALHTPGHSPGGVCLLADADGTTMLFSGDTLFRGGPGATGRSFSDRPTLLASIRDQLLGLPATTEVHTGHGDSTSIGAEADGVRAELAELADLDTAGPTATT